MLQHQEERANEKADKKMKDMEDFHQQSVQRQHEDIAYVEGLQRKRLLKQVQTQNQTKIKWVFVCLFILDTNMRQIKVLEKQNKLIKGLNTLV